MKALCIGGIADGEWKEIDPNNPYIVIAKKSKSMKYMKGLERFLIRP
jgi:hypothetical protein